MDDGFTVIQDFLSKYPEIEAVWASDDDKAIGVLEAIELTALNFTTRVPISGRIIIDSVLITPENAEKFYFPDSPF